MYQVVILRLPKQAYAFRFDPEKYGDIMLNLHSVKIITLATLGFVLAACGGDSDSTVNSNDVTSSQIFATFEIYSDGGDQVYAYAQLTKDEPPTAASDDDIFIRLVDEDKLWFSAGENIDDINLNGDLFSALERLEQTQIHMTRSSNRNSNFFGSNIFYNNVWYSGRLPQSDEGRYGVALLREIDSDAKYSSVQMPSAFTISSPEIYNTFSRSADAMSIEWFPTQAGLTISLEINSSCLNDEFASYTQTINSDTGSIILDAGTLDSPYLTGSCTTTIDLVKTELGQFDSAFDGGRISASQTRSVTITTTD